MATSPNVKDLFTPLNVRLYSYYETKAYIQQATSEYEYHPDVDGEILVNTYDHTIIDTIGKSASLFDDGEVYLEAEKYKKRIKNIMENLQLTKSERVIYEAIGLDVDKAVTEERQAQLLARHRKEMERYIEGLDVIMKAREGANVNADNQTERLTTSATREIVINLPENFTVKQLQASKPAKLSLGQSALFLSYLRDTDIIPPYSDSALGKLAEALLVRNQKTIRDDLSDIHNLKRSKVHLEVLKLEISTLLELVENDLKKAR